MRGLLRRAVLLLLATIANAADPTVFGHGAQAETPAQGQAAFLANRALSARQLGVIVNEADPLSVRIGDYYRDRRRIPAENMIQVQFPADNPVLTPKQFALIKAAVDKKTPAQVQAYALTWIVPYRVGCMSITTAFAAGFDHAFCADGCKPTRPSPYFDSASRAPYSDLGWRPTIVLAARNFSEARRLIDRGVDADRSFPVGTAYLLSTPDAARNVRAAYYDEIEANLGPRFLIKRIVGDRITGADDVMFYFTGLKDVPDIRRNHFLPGAIADHLTSAGGALLESSQMSSLRWLEAGATASYGAVVEPCSYPQKFPHPGVVMSHYLDGESLIEAYWKSVAWPGQGIFIGEPLATPFRL